MTEDFSTKTLSLSRVHAEFLMAEYSHLISRLYVGASEN